MRSSHSFLQMLNSTRETANAAMMASAAGGRPPGPPCTTSPPLVQWGALRYRRYKELKESGGQSLLADVMSSEAAAGDKRSALDAPHTHDDDGCAVQGEGAGAAGGASASTSALRPAAVSRVETSSV